MNTFSTELKKEREAKNITLLEISKKTRINIKYLEALEQGAFDILPQTYIRAFIKGYADSIGIPSADILRKYEIHAGPKYAEPPSGEVSLHSSFQPEETERALDEENKKRNIFYGIVLLAIVLSVSVYVYKFLDSSDGSRQTKETPFREVVQEQEKSKTPPPVVDTAAISKPVLPVVSDSLTLRMVAIDSVWISVTRDSLPARQGYLLNGKYRTYMAKHQFKISLGNAGAMRLFLNGKELPPLGQKGHSVRNVIINIDDLKQQ